MVKLLAFLHMFFALTLAPSVAISKEDSVLPKYLENHILLKYPTKQLPSTELKKKPEPHYKEPSKQKLYIKVFFKKLNKKIEESAYFSSFVRDNFKNADIKYYQIIKSNPSRDNPPYISDSNDFEVFETFGAIPDFNAEVARHLNVTSLPVVRLAYNGQIRFLKLKEYEPFTIKFLKKLK